MNLVSENIRFMRIFAGVPLGAGVKRHWGLSTTAIFGDLGGYVFDNFRVMASNNMWRYATPCPPENDCKVNDLEWSWVAISWQNAFSASTSWIRAFVCQKLQPLRFCGVLCIARSVSQPIIVDKCTADALFLCGSWASCYMHLFSSRRHQHKNVFKNSCHVFTFLNILKKI